MPTVPAAGYPTGPEAPPQIDPRLPVDDFLRIDARPEAFGGAVGTALTRAGGELEKGAGELAQAAISRQDFFNKVASDNANTEFMKESHKLFYGDPDAGVNPVTGQANKPGFFALKGQDAIDAGPPNDALDKLQRDIGARLPNDRARLDFNTETRRLRTYQDGEISRHWDEQLKTAGTTTLAAKADLHDRDAATYFNDPTRLADILETGRQDATKAAQIANGMNADPAILADARAKSDAKVYGSAYRAAIAAGQLDRADALKNEAIARGIWTGQQADEAERLIEPKRNQQIGKDAGRTGFTGGGGGGAARATGLVPYTPSSDMLSGTGMSADQYEIFRSHVAARESGSYAQPPNAGGYMGRYQMGSSEIKDTANRLGVPVPTQQQFLSDPALQERFFENYTLDHHNSLMAQSAQYRNAPPTEKAAILMGAHLGGVQGVQNYLAGKSDPADSNGTHISDYVTSMRRAMAGGAAPAAQPATATPSSGAIEVWGDSLGVGLNSILKTPGHTKSGAPTTDILDDIKAQPEDSWAGKTVVLSSGSNGPKMSEVRQTIEYLQAHKANVVVVGYGTKGQLPQRNVELQQMAGELKVPVIAAEQVGPDGVHPGGRGYQSMADKIRAAAGGSPATGKPQTAPEGAIISSPGKPPMQNVGGKWVPYLPEGV
jgi:hypothetical protein